MPDYGVGSWPHRRARISRERVALRQDGRELTYRRLADERCSSQPGGSARSSSRSTPG
jgi:fatty-acyl-CoA synthase